MCLGSSAIAGRECRFVELVLEDRPRYVLENDNSFYQECRALGRCTPASAGDSLSCCIMRIVIRARTHESWSWAALLARMPAGS